jgi:hypothetical protein
MGDENEKHPYVKIKCLNSFDYFDRHRSGIHLVFTYGLVRYTFGFSQSVSNDEDREGQVFSFA